MTGASSINFNWDDDAIEALKSLWADGLSCSRIAQAMGNGLSRSAVIGKVHRLNLPARIRTEGVSRKRVYPEQRNRVVRITPIAARVKVIGAPHPDPALLENGQRIGTMDLKPCHCRWPHGDPLEPDFHYCGLMPESGSPYCDFHKIRAADKGHAPSPEQGALGRKAESDAARTSFAC